MWLSPAAEVGSFGIMKPRRIPLLVLLCIVDCGSCQRRVRLVPPMNATAVCPTSLGDVRDVSTTLWFFPNGTRVSTTQRVIVSEVFGVLNILDPTAEDLGVYMCVSISDSTHGQGKGDMNATLSFVEIYTAQPRTVADRLWLGGLASLCVLVTVVFVYLVCRFRYRNPSAENGKSPVGGMATAANRGFDQDEISTVF